MEDRMRLGLSHQRPEDLTPEYLAYLRQVGVEAVEVRTLRERATLEHLREIKRTVESAGLELHEIMLNDFYNCERIATWQDEAEDDLRFFVSFLEDLERTGITATTYAWHTGGSYQTGRGVVRGCDTRSFDLNLAGEHGNVYEHTFTADELWDNYERFLAVMQPAAVRTGVRMQLHPNDPPADHAGVPRIFSSTAAFRRAMELGGNTSEWGILFCVGTWAEMSGADGHGENIGAALAEFTGKGLVHQVHLRNIDSPLPVFSETLPDNGYVNLGALVRILAEAQFDGIIVPDHVPIPIDSVADQRTMEAFSLGYIRALMQSAEV